MFTGWVFNMLAFAFLDSFVTVRRKTVNLLLVALQIPVIGMMISFPWQGYGMWSVIFSTLHTAVTVVFIILFFKEIRNHRHVSSWFARIAWIFFLLSTAGPFLLGYLAANGLGQSHAYYFAVYYYLHFQYNGFFMFGIFSLFFQLLESAGIAFRSDRIRKAGIGMTVSCVPAYFLSILFANPGLVFNIAGGLAALIQLVAFITIAKEILSLQTAVKRLFTPASFFIFCIVALCLFLKLLLQLISAHPVIAQMAYALRPVVIAYLHLVLIGIISFFLMIWLREKQAVHHNLWTWATYTMLIGFIGSEFGLVILPWWSTIVPNNVGNASAWIFFFSVFLAIGSMLLLLSSMYARQNAGYTARSKIL